MFGFGTRPATNAGPSWLAEMQETQQRWQGFIGKLVERMDELCESALPELEALARDDADTYQQNYSRMLAGVRGQLSNMRDKVREVREDKIEGFVEEHDDEPENRSLIRQFRETCRQIEQPFEDKHWQWWQRLEDTAHCDLEARYQRILDEYAAIKDRFTCQQCGGPISIEKIYFLTTYLPCPHCQTQNTFAPSMQARQLESLGRSLAEQRTAPLLQAHETQKEQERAIRYQIHCLRGEHDSASTTQRQTLQQELEAARAHTDALYQRWLRTMFDEWNKVVPDLSEQNERFYQRLLDDYSKHSH